MERWGFDQKTLPKGFIKKGKAFGSGPVFRRLPKQRRIEGPVVGRFLSSFHGGDKTTGRIESPKFTLTGSAMHVLVAGGNQCKKVYLGLLIDGKLRRRICGRNDETFRPETISLKRWQGKEAQLVVVDESKGKWGHIMVDEIVVSSTVPEP